MAARTNWRLVGWISLGLFALCALILADAGLTEAGVRGVIRNTARTSLILFLLAFSASALRRFWQSRLSAWLLRNRRYLGVSFAVSHGLHLLSIAALAVWWPHPFVEHTAALTVIGGGLAYVFVLAMVITSFDKTAALLSKRSWRLLHTTGSYIVWGIFAFSYLGKVVSAPLYIPAFAALVLALALRIAALARKK